MAGAPRAVSSCLTLSGAVPRPPKPRLVWWALTRCGRTSTSNEQRSREGSDEAPLSLSAKLTARCAVPHSQIQTMAFAPGRSVAGVPFGDDDSQVEA